MRRDGGKGDKPRPVEDRKKFEENWDTIFKKKEKPAPTPPKQFSCVGCYYTQRRAV